ncbi:MAG: hypothetical protein HOC53_06120 [Candidatus Nitrosopelagicus sp.]|nr:hypothetical protein [Candidatus Nitrosopelagicus sp.]MBT5171531.1 hypothetical protein [Candidatus Nitrosopelagicus sp.]MBT6646051.1 hypothetical protein [Nitrososphaerota archaeon]
MKDIEIKIDNMNIKPHEEITGHITVNYSGLYDGIVINTQILGSNELVVWREYNGKKITQNVSRLFVNKDVMPDNKVDFTATIEFEPNEEYDVKFRTSIIQQHKEVENAQLFANYSA